MDGHESVSSHLYHSTFYLRAARRIARGTAYKSMATSWYLRQISGIAIEGHRRTRKSCSSSLSSAKISLLVGSRVADESLRFGGEYGRARIYALRRSLARITSHMQRVHMHACEYPASSRGLYACIYEPRYARARLPEAAGDSICGSHGSRWRSYKLNICRLVCACVL